MAWQEIYKVEPGEFVHTPEGLGRVTRQSAADGRVQVDVKGQLYEFRADQVSKTNETGRSPEGGEYDAPGEAEGDDGQGENTPDNNDNEGEQMQINDKVQKVDNPSTTGKVINVNQRTVKVKWDANGKVANFPKSSVGKPGSIKKTEPSFKVGDKVTAIGTQGQFDDHRRNLGKTGTVETVDGDGGVHVRFEDGDGSSYFKEYGPIEKAIEKVEDKKEDKAEQPKQDKADDTIKKTGDALSDLMQLKDHMEKTIEQQVEGELKDIRDLAKKSQILEVKIDGEAKGKVEGHKHNQLEQLINYAAIRMNPLLVGMAGTGKTHAGEQVSKALGLEFYAMSVGAQTSKSDIIGYMDASGKYVKTHFRDAYEKGGVFLMDEIDAGNANVLIQVNAALSNGLCAFPDKMVERHEDFIFIASANTYGNGANRQYVGRNQLDAATLDRFAIIDWLIDEELEKNLASGLYAKPWYMAVKAARQYVADKSIRALVSPRATQKGSKLLHIGQDLDEVIDATMLGSVPEDKRSDVKNVAKTVFNKYSAEVPSKLEKPQVKDLIAPF